MRNVLLSAALVAAVTGCSSSDRAPTDEPAVQTSAAPSAPAMRILSPQDGAEVVGPTVTFEVEVSGLTLVDAGTPLAEGEGHLHFFIDTPPDAVPEGQLIPLDSTTKYVHAGKAPYTSRALTLAPGEHTIWVVAANSGHLALRTPAPVKVSVKVR